jgi:gamma-glutamyltranspeptidase/glutathione hydrolase
LGLSVVRFSPLFAIPLLLSGCGVFNAAKTTLVGSDDKGPKVLSGFIGGVVADEPRAALAARQILALGGNAADAAVTLGFMLSVTLPSRASLGGGGECVAYQPGGDSPNRGVPEAILFPPMAPAARGGDRPAAVPMMARGLYLLSARYGTQQFAQLVAPAEQAAKFGFPVSRALARDLAVVKGPLEGDPAAAAIFAPGGRQVGEGDRLIQSDLGGTLAQIQVVGVGYLYEGLLGHKMAEAATQAGGPLTAEDMRNGRPALAAPVVSTQGNDRIASTPGAAQAPTGAALPASTSFVVVDRKGGAVACALTMNNLFGTGRVAPGTGILLAASPAAKPAASLPAGIAWNENIHAFRAAVASSGQNGAVAAQSAAMAQALAGGDVGPVPDPGRANAISCPGYVPGSPATCRFFADPRNSGLAEGGG